MSLATVGPFDTTPIADTLRAAVPDFVDVGQAADVASAQSSNVAAPCAFVILGAEVGGARQGGSDAYRQRATATIGVLLAVRVHNDQAGGAASAPMTDLLTKTRKALLGTLPAGALTKLEFADGRILAMDEDATVWWLDRYRCDYWISQ